MSSARLLAAAGAAALLAIPAAHAADLGPPPPCGSLGAPACAAPIFEASGWYLRGDIGMSNQKLGSLDNVANGPVTTQFLNFDSAPIADVGIGYQINSWLRVDATAEYRANAHFHGQQVVTFGAGPTVLPDDYNASKSEWLFLANAYIDLGTWWNVTPFVGVGIGASRNTITSFVDQGATQSGATILSTTHGADASKWNFAWAAYAGLAYQVSPAFTVEMSWRYLDLGSATTGPTAAFDGSFSGATPFVFKDLTSQDVRLGFRWMLDAPPPPPPPLMRRG